MKTFKNKSEVNDYFHWIYGKPQCEIIPPYYFRDKHLHKEVEMVFVAEGSLVLAADDHIYNIQQGELVFVSDNVVHQYHSISEDARVIKIKFLRKWIIEYITESQNLSAFNQIFENVFRVRTDAFLRESVMRMLNCQIVQYADIFYLGIIISMIAYIMEYPQVIVESRPVSIRNQLYTDKALTYIYENLCEKITLKNLAEYLGIMEQYCSKYFKRNLGMKFLEFVNATRITYAQRLLLYTEDSVIDIAYKTGYSSIQSFNRNFKTVTGVPPREFRSSRGKKEAAV